MGANRSSLDRDQGAESGAGRARLVLGGAVALAIAITALVAARPEVPFAVRSTSLHAAVETAAACIALLAALLAFVRFQRRRLAPDLALSAAFLVFGLANLCFSVLPTVVAGFALDAYDTWAALAARLAGASLLCAAALLPPRQVHGRRPGWWLSAGVAGLLGTIATVVFFTADRLPAGVGLLDVEPLDLAAPMAYPAVAGAQGIAFVLYGLAVAGFARRARQEGDEFATWLAAAAVLAATARLHYLLYPSLYAEVVYSGDLLRLGFYALVLTGAARELVGYWRELAVVAVLEERRRLARDLHDGVAQELAFISAQARQTARGPHADEGFGLIASAAERALDESRRAIRALAASGEESLDSAIAQSAEEVAGRVGARVHLELQPQVHVDPRLREALVRVTREAVTNATRHGHSDTVLVRLAADEDLRLAISDEGTGFDTRVAREGPGGFGLVSMRERVEAVGGRLRIRSAPGQGTDIEVVVPWTSRSGS